MKLILIVIPKPHKQLEILFISGAYSIYVNDWTHVNIQLKTRKRFQENYGKTFHTTISKYTLYVSYIYSIRHYTYYVLTQFFFFQNDSRNIYNLPLFIYFSNITWIPYGCCCCHVVTYRSFTHRISVIIVEKENTHTHTDKPHDEKAATEVSNDSTERVQRPSKRYMYSWNQFYGGRVFVMFLCIGFFFFFPFIRSEYRWPRRGLVARLADTTRFTKVFGAPPLTDDSATIATSTA